MLINLQWTKSTDPYIVKLPTFEWLTFQCFTQDLLELFGIILHDFGGAGIQRFFEVTVVQALKNLPKSIDNFDEFIVGLPFVLQDGQTDCSVHWVQIGMEDSLFANQIGSLVRILLWNLVHKGQLCTLIVPWLWFYHDVKRVLAGFIWEFQRHVC